MLVALCALTLLGGFYWLTRPVPLVWRWFGLALLAALLAAMLLPPAIIADVRAGLAWLIPPSDSLTRHSSAPFWVHFALFFAYSTVLFWQRRDLPVAFVLAGLVGLAVSTEGLQLLVDGRYGSWLDVGINIAGVGVAAVVVRMAVLVGCRYGG